MGERDRNGASGKLDTLRVLLDTASTLVDEIATNREPLLERWVSAFLRMPAEDRETILGVVEREVELRNVSRESRDTVSGFQISRPSPNARLYARAFGEPAAYSTSDEVMRATLRAARIILVAPPPRGDWEVATLQAFRALSAEERVALAAHNREMLILLERIDRETPT